MKKRLNILSISICCTVVTLLLTASSLHGQTKIKDLVEIKNAEQTSLIGYGLVTGLNRTGDRSLGRSGATFTVQSISNMLQNFGIDIDSEQLRTRNVAAVMVTTRLSSFHGVGSAVDVTVSSLGDANSIRGGVLLQTPLMNPLNKEIYAYAQGPLVTGSIQADIPGASLSRNQSLTATIPGGGSVIKNNTYMPVKSEPLGLILSEPNFTNTARISEAINSNFDDETIAQPKNAGEIEITWPQGFESTGDLNFFLSTILNLTVNVDVPARVVINERTGTVVAGGQVLIGEAFVSHGNIQVQTQVTPFVSQPPAFSGGQTIVGAVPSVGITEQRAQNFVLENNTNVTDLAQSLSDLGLSSRDIISIFQALDKAGALKGKLIIM